MNCLKAMTYKYERLRHVSFAKRQQNLTDFIVNLLASCGFFFLPTIVCFGHCVVVALLT